MFDRFISWISQYPKLHVFYLTWIFLGLVFGWVILIMPFHIYDGFRKDFQVYFTGLREICDKAKKKESNEIKPQTTQGTTQDADS